jgi:hypothetical protein
MSYSIHCTNCGAMTANECDCFSHKKNELILNSDKSMFDAYRNDLKITKERNEELHDFIKFIDDIGIDTAKLYDQFKKKGKACGEFTLNVYVCHDFGEPKGQCYCGYSKSEHVNFSKAKR